MFAGSLEVAEAALGILFVERCGVGRITRRLIRVSGRVRRGHFRTGMRPIGGRNGPSSVTRLLVSHVLLPAGPFLRAAEASFQSHSPCAASIHEADVFATAQDLGREFCLAVQGAVRARQPGRTNNKIATGAVELKAGAIHVLNRCPTPPFEVAELPGTELANEDLRLQYRYLDLRRPSIQRVLMQRHRCVKCEQ